MAVAPKVPAALAALLLTAFNVAHAQEPPYKAVSYTHLTLPTTPYV